MRVALVEDQRELRESWSKLINSFPDFICVAAYSSGEEALEKLPACNPEIVLMDIFLTGMSGIECTSTLKERLPKVQIIILTAVDDDEMVFRALEAGATGYLLKRTRPSDLRESLQEVLRGGAPMTSEIARRVVNSFRRRGLAREDLVKLTAREEEILVHLSKGYSNKEIGSHLDLGVETVRSHLKHIYEKLHVRCRAAAVAQFITSKTGGTKE